MFVYRFRILFRVITILREEHVRFFSHCPVLQHCVFHLCLKRSLQAPVSPSPLIGQLTHT